MRMNIFLKAEINGLARFFYKVHGYNQTEDYDFSKAKHPQERLMWQMALSSWQYWSAREDKRQKAKKS